MSLISNNLKYLRRINGLTQDQFARRIGTKRANVGAYEESRAVPPVDTLKIIANTFGITVDDFVKKDIRKLRETPDLTFGFEAKPLYDQDEPPKEEVSLKETFSNEEDPFDLPPSIGDLMKQFLGNEPSIQEKSNEVRTTENVSQSVTLKPSFERETFVEPKPIIPPTNTQTTNNQPISQNIELVRRFQFNDYLVKLKDFQFIKTLTTFNMPTLPNGNYRAFEAGEDFAFEGALLIGNLVSNWQDIIDGKNYVLVTKSQGIIYRRVYNQVKIKGTLLLSTDNNRFPSTEISFMDVIETWDIKAFVSHILPQPNSPY
jgi:transcriptional regulator with XRE-family HTH domain